MTLKYVAGLALVAATAGLACSDFGPTTRVLPAFIVFFGDTSTISAPDTVDRGSSFDVRIKTFGGGCTRSTGGADLALHGQVAEIRPLNVTEMSRGTVCSADLLFLFHVVAVRLDLPGTATIRVVGQRRDATTGSTDVADTLERRIVVR